MGSCCCSEMGRCSLNHGACLIVSLNDFEVPEPFELFGNSCNPFRRLNVGFAAAVQVKKRMFGGCANIPTHHAAVSKAASAAAPIGGDPLGVVVDHC